MNRKFIEITVVSVKVGKSGIPQEVMNNRYYSDRTHTCMYFDTKYEVPNFNIIYNNELNAFVTEGHQKTLRRDTNVQQIKN